MKILNEKPPIWKEAKKYFDFDPNLTIFTWGDTIYNPAGYNIGRELVEHESVHSKQQEATGGPQKWWEKYFADPVFRANQEAEAYGRQFAYVCTLSKDRERLNKHLWKLAEFLSSPMYKVNMSHIDAMKAIRFQANKVHHFE